MSVQKKFRRPVATSVDISYQLEQPSSNQAERILRVSWRWPHNEKKQLTESPVLRRARVSNCLAQSSIDVLNREL